VYVLGDSAELGLNRPTWRARAPSGPRAQDGRVALAALEPHFAKALMEQVGAGGEAAANMFKPTAHQAVAQFVAGKTRRALDALAQRHDLPLLTMR
jgi:hypothetical protein